MSRSVLAVPPVEIISAPNCERCVANSTAPVLSDKLMRARLIVFDSVITFRTGSLVPKRKAAVSDRSKKLDQ